MGQRATSERESQAKDAAPSFATGMPRLSVFATDLGWFGLIGYDQTVLSLSIGHASEQEVRDRCLSGVSREFIERLGWDGDWNPDLRRQLVRFARGEYVSFDDVVLPQDGLTEFQQRVYAGARAIPYGERLSYAELAEKVGSPRAARAVGNCMRQNRVPIIIPCHRVVGAGGRLGGFSAPTGITLKQTLLQMEAETALACVSA